MDDVFEEFGKKWHIMQKEGFIKSWNERWKIFFSGMELDGLDCFLEEVLKLERDKFEDVNYTFAKLEKILQICNFLEELRFNKPSQDTEQIIISIIVSGAEAFYRLNRPKEEISDNLIRGFFSFIKEKLKYKIRSHYPHSMPYEKCFDEIETLYLLRNDYIHNANFLGIFFSSDGTTKPGLFHFSKKEDKSKLIAVHSEFTITYRDFIELFKEAFWKNIIQFIKGKN